MNLKYVIGLLLLVSCTPADDFSNTNRVITTDKNEYKLGDQFELTLTIQPLDKEKKIRIYRNFKNLEVSFALVDSNKDMVNETWSKHSGQFLKDSEIIALTISKENPFHKDF